jgi:hypothetical protein
VGDKLVEDEEKVNAEKILRGMVNKIISGERLEFSVPDIEKYSGLKRKAVEDTVTLMSHDKLKVKILKKIGNDRPRYAISETFIILKEMLGKNDKFIDNQLNKLNK